MSVYRSVHDAVFDLHVSAEVSFQVELAGAVRALEWLAAGVQMHVAEEVVHSVERLSAHLRNKSAIVSAPPRSISLARSETPTCFTHLAFERLDRQVDNHVRFKRLLLDEGLEADVALEGPHTGMDQHVSLQVGRQGELSGTDVTLEFFHTLGKQEVFGPFN